MNSVTNGLDVQRDDAEAGSVIAPSMLPHDDSFSPKSPSTMEETGIERQVLSNLALKLAYSTTKFSTQWASQQLCLPLQIVGELLDELRQNRFRARISYRSPNLHLKGN